MPLLDYLDNFIQEAQAAPLPAWELPAEPAYLYGNQRRLRQVDAPRPQQRRWQSIHEFRLHVQAEMRRYMAEPEPEHMLLIPAPPGSGKTWAGVEFAHWVYETTTRRVLYAGPRTDFFVDILNTAVSQEQDLRMWYDWKARRRDDENPDRHTCNHAETINEWLDMGYEGMEFCKKVCGFDYIEKGCSYHAQKKRTEPLIYGNHQHVVMGHPLADQFAVVVGDELPISAFVKEWTLPPKRIQFGDIPFEYPIAELINELSRLAGAGIKNAVSGPELLGWLGGPERVLGAVDGVLKDDFVMANVIAPEIPRDNNLDKVPANYLPIFLPILQQEARAALAEEEYPHRLYVDSRGLTMLTRRAVNEQMPKHVIWFDATGTPDLYNAMFQRPVQSINAQPKPAGRIYQITDRSNGKSSLLQYGKTPPATQPQQPTETNKAGQMRAQIEQICRGYRNPAIITYQQLEATITGKATGHFYGSRGTNQFELCDVLVVAGTPMPPIYQIEAAAKCLWPARMRPFDTNWYTAERLYQFAGADGKGYAYPVSQFADPELNVLLWQYREGEIIQAAHRSRMLFRDTPVYLLTNLPIDELPPDRLLTIRELFGAPEGVNVFGWGDVVAFVESLEVVTTNDLVERMGVNRQTAKKYMEIFVESYGWLWDEAIRKPGARGPLPKAIRK